MEKSFVLGFVFGVVISIKVIELLCNVGWENEVVEVLDRVENNGGVIDVVVYNILIKGFCKLGKVKVGLYFKK